MVEVCSMESVRHTVQANYSFLIRNSNFPGHLGFLFAKSDNSRHLRTNHDDDDDSSKYIISSFHFADAFN